MKIVVVGLGIQGMKRLAVAGSDVVATVDPVNSVAAYEFIEQVPLDTFDSALVCTPDDAKLGLLEYLLAKGKHVLVEKPLLVADESGLDRLRQIAGSTGATCYTAYNHRFEPHVVHLKQLLDAGTLGTVYQARFYYGNGTARDVRLSAWRDKGCGVLPDLGSHLLDMARFLFGDSIGPFEPWSFNCFENRSYDHVLFGTVGGSPVLAMEATLVSWRNTFSLDVYCELGTAHIQGLCKWGPSSFTIRKRVLPSGKPGQEVHTLECADPTWVVEYEHFKRLCRSSENTLENDVWIGNILNHLAVGVGAELLV